MDNQSDDQRIGRFQLLTLILSDNQCHKCDRIIKEKEIRGGMMILGRGTVSNTLLNVLGIKNQKRSVIKLLMKEERVKEMLDYLDEMLQLKKPGHGIAYTTPVLRVAGLSEQGTPEKQTDINAAQRLEGESMFKKLTVIVDRGMSSDVMDIALKAGVRGGTILHGRGTGAETATNLFGIEIEPEKELVIILMPNDLVDKVVNELTQGLNLDEPGKGILFIEPVIETRGLYEMI